MGSAATAPDRTIAPGIRRIRERYADVSLLRAPVSRMLGMNQSVGMVNAKAGPAEQRASRELISLTNRDAVEPSQSKARTLYVEPDAAERVVLRRAPATAALRTSSNGRSPVAGLGLACRRRKKSLWPGGMSVV
jgi:hypothetical protein